MEVTYMRQRVAKACQSCRSRKSKCDGQKPECGRCRGYGYTCVYRPQRPRMRTQTSTSPGSSVSERPSESCEAIAQQDDLLDYKISRQLAVEDRDDFPSKHPQIKLQPDNAISTDDTKSRMQTGIFDANNNVSGEPVQASSSYLGEVSDIRFFNLVKRFLQAQDGTGVLYHAPERYDLADNTISDDKMPYKNVPLPSPEEAKQYLSVYFSTIHIAYPFIPESLFMQEYIKICASDIQHDSRNSTQTALAYTICAIGAYYTSLSGKDDTVDSPHEKYFWCGLSITETSSAERSITQVSLLLARCFYLLVVCRTECCWTILGQAIRVAQSIGLHVENEESNKHSDAMEIEMRRRIWYSLYVLDRLVSLQLGRPPAIHDDDFDVPMPSRASDSEINWGGDRIEAGSYDSPSTGDYFLAVIAFSGIVGRALRNLHCPKRSHTAPEGLENTKNLDQQLLEWKSGLPRGLRFDLGHTFEKSHIFKRQRNMLAIKYHHLRALIYRPYLCHPLLMDPDADMSMVQLDWLRISTYGKTCILEARETARLLHSISSKEDLVSGFPFWQMISCLVCASSILLVSSVFVHAGHELSEFDLAGLYDDAETCLKVFDALSIRSPGARIARDMMKALKDCSLRWKGSGNMAPKAAHARAGAVDSTLDFTDKTLDLSNFSASLDSTESGQPLLLSGMPSTPNWYWPAEIVDSMAWSVQVLDNTQVMLGHRDFGERPQSEDSCESMSVAGLKGYPTVQSVASNTDPGPNGLQ